MSDEFYRSFEDKHRGSRELIKSRLAIYLPFIEPLVEMYPNSPAIDLGCGRGEWVELLSNRTSLDAQGVDLDSEMLKVCQQYGLQCELHEAVSYLSKLDDNSQAIVSGFHIAEHIPFPQLQELVKQAHRVLKPAGLLILETPNPENIVVGTAEFYMDPTHERPLPPNLLAFVTEYYSFKRTKIARLQEEFEFHANEKELTLLDVLKEVSPDYAIIAQKEGAVDSLSKFDDSFDKDYGLTLQTLADRYEHNRMNQLLQAEAKTQAAEAKTLAAIEQLNQLQKSTSWRITSPLRTISQFIKNMLRSNSQ